MNLPKKTINHSYPLFVEYEKMMLDKQMMLDADVALRHCDADTSFADLNLSYNKRDIWIGFGRKDVSSTMHGESNCIRSFL